MSKFHISEVMDNYINNTLKEEAEKQRQLDAFVRRMTSRSPDITDQYKAAPQPGHGPGTYQPRARATGKDVVSLFIPADSFDVLEYKDFQRARDQAISWLRSHKYAVEQGQKLCWGPAFDLDPEPLSYRDTDGVSWYNCSIDTEQDYLRARVSASY